jgi:hypothetical protein
VPDKDPPILVYENVIVLKTFSNSQIFNGKIAINENKFYLYYENNFYQIYNYEKESDA